MIGETRKWRKLQLKQKARHYYDLGFNVLPVRIYTKKGKEIKKPNVQSWKRWQTIRMTEEEFSSLSWSSSDYFGVICGFNGFTSIDCDNLNEEDLKKADMILNQPVTEKIKTKRGFHWNYQDGNVRRGEKHENEGSSFEYLGVGNFVIVGGLDDRYRRLNDNPPRQVNNVYGLYKKALESLGWIEKTPLKQLEEKKEIRPCITAALNGKSLEHAAGDKMRLCCACEYLNAGYDVNQIVEVFRHAPAVQLDFKEEITRKKIEYAKAKKYKAWKCKKIRKLGFCLGAEDCEWNKKFVQSKKEKQGEKRESQADTLIKLCLAHNPTLFQDQHRTAYVKVEQSSVHVNLKVRSKPFKSWLAGLLWRHEEKAPGTEALYAAINVLEAKALFEGEKHQLYNRVAPAKDGFWIDMADDKWRAIKVTGEGWKIIEDPPILFKRFSHQLPLTTPVPGGDPWRFLDFINVRKKDKVTRLTLLCAIISYLIPNIPHPILVVYGIQGSAKTWLFKFIRKLIDPSIIEVLTLPRNERERVQQLDHNWCAFYDNVTKLPSWMSDTLCRAATGGGFSKRELYTDDSDITYSFKRCVGINGINIAAQRGDLLDRSLLIGLQDIPKTRRRTEKQLLAEFEGCKAEILGAFLDTLVKAIQLYPQVNPKGLFRMADFTRWGCAIAMALGYTQQDFINAYEMKVKMQIEEAALASPVATVLINLMESIKKWDGTPSQLYIALLNDAKELGVSTRQKAWPKAPHVLVRELNELTPSLKALGWEVVTGVKSGSTRRILINSVSSVPSVPENNDNNEHRDARDGRDASFQSSSNTLIPVKSWCLANRNERSEISLIELAEFIAKELEQEPKRVIDEAFKQSILSPSPHIGKAVVV